MFGSRKRSDRAVEAIAVEVRDLRASMDAMAGQQAKDADVAHARRRALVWVGVILACVFTAASIGLVAVALPASPTAPDPGRIGVVVPDDPDGAVQVYAAFSADVDSKAHFKLILSVLPSTASVARSASFGVFFCGAIREGLQLTQANTTEAPSPVPVEQDILEFDSRLGYRSECDFVEVSSDLWQVALFGTSDLALATVAGEKVLYAVPGVTTTSVEENVNGELMQPLALDSTLRVEMTDIPADLAVTASAPQLPAAGTLAWSFADIRGVNAPSQYRVSGILGDRESVSRALLFAAGALIGLAGAALIWAIEGIVETILLRRRARATA